MRLPTSFVRLPFRFDVERLRVEAAQFAPSQWRLHPQGHPGNSALPLVARSGNADDDGVNGPMRATRHLARCPYVVQVMAAFNAPIARSRLMRLEGNAEASAHSDVNYYWQERLRVHVPVITHAEVRFECGGESVHMAAGECWVFDTWRRHNVINPRATERIHLVIDTVGSGALWEHIADSGAPTERVAFDPHAQPTLAFESENFPTVMTPWEQRQLLAWLREDLLHDGQKELALAGDLFALAHRFHHDWRALWAVHGSREEGWPHYRRLVDELDAGLRPYTKRVFLRNGLEATEIARHFLLLPALDTARQTTAATASASSSVARPARPVPAREAVAAVPRATRFDRPLFIVAAPRSGSSLLFETLARSPSVWTVGGESHRFFERIDAFNPAKRGWDSNRLTAGDFQPEPVAILEGLFLTELRNRDGKLLPANNDPFRFLEKTPKNSLRVAFLNAAFADARFIYLYREPRDNLSSMIDAWNSGGFVTYPNLPGWHGMPWSLALIPGWRELIGKPLSDIVAQQWEETNRAALDDLGEIAPERWCAVSYGELLSAPQATIERLAAFAEIEWDEPLAGALPLSAHTLTPPDPDKWRRNAELLAHALPGVEAIAVRARRVAGVTRAQTLDASHVGGELAAPPPMSAPFATAAPVQNTRSRIEKRFESSYTTTLPQLLEKFGASLAISTYQAGFLIIARAKGAILNTHFIPFPRPMGLACDGKRLLLGTDHEIVEYCNVPDVAAKVKAEHTGDACYVGRRVHVTGNIDVHELVLGRDDLWLVNTRFSCLCTLAPEVSFVPRWRPSYVSGLSPEDRCHLNGLALVDGEPRYVVALGECDHPMGWRENKAFGGVLIDVESNRVVARGLSMPHSPRWYRDRLWLLESGEGALVCVDPASGAKTTIATLPGFTRGLDFFAQFAFVGLSQVRESSSFSGIPITQRALERTSGVWVVNIDSGETVGFLRFNDAIQEVFAVQILPHAWPEVLEFSDPLSESSYVLPNDALSEVRDAPRSMTSPSNAETVPIMRQS